MLRMNWKFFLPKKMEKRCASQLSIQPQTAHSNQVELFDEGDDSETEPAPAKNKRGKPKNRSHEGDPFAPPKSKKKSSEDHLEELNPRDYETLVGDIVRYILYRDATKQAIKRAEIGDKVPRSRIDKLFTSVDVGSW